MRAKALVSDQGQWSRVFFWADVAFMGGLGIIILSLPISEGFKNAGYFITLGGWLTKRAATRDFRITFTPVGVFLSLYLLVSLLSATSAIDSWEGMRGTWDVFRPLSLFLMMVNDIDSAPKVQLCTWLFVTSTGISVAWSLVNYFTRHDLRLDLKSLGHPNTTAMYLVMMSALLISLLLLMDWTVYGRMAVGALAGATFLALFLTYSRGGWMAFLACLIFLNLAQASEADLGGRSAHHRHSGCPSDHGEAMDMAGQDVGKCHPGGECPGADQDMEGVSIEP